MRKFAAKSLGVAIAAIAILATANVHAGSIVPDADKLALNVRQQLNQSPSQHNFLIYKYLLDMGARANGTKKDTGGGGHAAWCAKIHKSYDPASNTFTAFNGKTYTCRSPYQ